MIEKIKHSNPQSEAFLNLMKSPDRDQSIVKGVPLALLPVVKNLLREAFPNKILRVYFRGPRKGDGRGKYSQQSNCTKRTATSAAIYFMSDYLR